MILALALAALAVVLCAAAWWGANVVFHPPKMLRTLARPGDFSLPYSAVEFSTFDGPKLKGWLIPAARETDRTVMLVHGWGDNKGDVLERFHWLRESFNLFLFDSRAHGESGGPLSTIGHLEAVDVDAALACLRAERPAWAERLGFCGYSMGASMAVHAMARDLGVRCAVLESPFRSFNDVVARFAWNHYRLPRFPLVYMILAVIRLRLGTDPEPSSPIYHVARLAPRPVLFIAGSEDRLMPEADVRALHAAAGEPKELWVIAGARHGKCHEVAGEDYPRKIREFFDKNL
ncbi:MAG TPA: alpha/beta hydrolase [Elusimicrobiota bacterium]|nr:alpha/beta hydrolase [Elusimicrobiota bacterium]